MEKDVTGDRRWRTDSTRVIHNIISNAIKYMDQAKRNEGHHQIRVKDVGDFIQVEIEDNGKGIAAKGPAIYF